MNLPEFSVELGELDEDGGARNAKVFRVDHQSTVFERVVGHWNVQSSANIHNSFSVKLSKSIQALI